MTSPAPNSDLPRDLTGHVFSRLTVIEDSGRRDNQGNVLWRCRCSCGGEKLVNRVHLRRGMVVSCGCAAKEQKSLALKTHREAQEALKAATERIKELEASLEAFRLDNIRLRVERRNLQKQASRARGTAQSAREQVSRAKGQEPTARHPYHGDSVLHGEEW